MHKDRFGCKYNEFIKFECIVKTNYSLGFASELFSIS
jgi:hypothetical protein